MKLFYRKYPALQKAIAGRNAEYNRTMEKDTDKLRTLYDEGYAIAQQLMIEL
jgi:predicted patatin/cPLA2 family phospholipase